MTQTFTASRVQVTPESISMQTRFAQAGGCAFNGRLAAARKGS